MHFLFVSHQSDQPFLRYGQNSGWPWKNTSEIFKRKFVKITVFNRISPKSNQVITMTRATELTRFVVIRWVVLTLLSRQPLLLNDATAVTLGQGHGKVIQYITPEPYILRAKYQRFRSNGFDVRGKGFCGGGRGRGGRGGNELKT